MLQMVYDKWHVVDIPEKGDPMGVFWECRENTGAQADGGFAFPDLTCFFQPGVLLKDGGLPKGHDYIWYLTSYGPTGDAVGGIKGFTNPNSADGDPNDLAKFRIAGPVGPIWSGL